MPGNASTVDMDLAMVLLTAAVQTDPHGKAGVARRLGAGYGRSLLSRVLSPADDKAMTPDLARRVLDVYHIAMCPATSTIKQRAECERIAVGPAPTHNPLSMRIWKTCQTCQFKPSTKGDPK